MDNRRKTKRAGILKLRFIRRFEAVCAFVLIVVFTREPAVGAERPGISAASISITADFPGGNIVVDKIDGDTIRLHQDERDTPQFWFHWYFEVSGAQGRTLTFAFTKGNVFGPRGPAVSLDSGRSWDWLGTSAVSGDSFRYTFRPDLRKVRFAFAIPYTEKNLRSFLKRHASNSAVRHDELVKTPKHRSVELLRVGRLNGEAKYRILITCRHHACESIANFVLEGVLDSALDDTPDGRWFRERSEILAVPFMDKDGVEAGDQGKLRKPYDHWLDYGGKSLYTETRALRNLFKQEPRHPSIDLAIDLHCPYIRDAKIYFALGSDPRIAGSTARFCRLFEQMQNGPLVYQSHDNSAFGTGWNVAATYAGRRSFWQWAQTLPNVRVVGTLEVPYATVGNVAVTPHTARALGHDLATAIRAFLDTAPR